MAVRFQTKLIIVDSVTPNFWNFYVIVWLALCNPTYQLLTFTPFCFFIIFQGKVVDRCALRFGVIFLSIQFYIVIANYILTKDSFDRTLRLWGYDLEIKKIFLTPTWVTNMITSLGWQSLEQRRQNSRLCMLYKIQHNLIDINRDLYIRHGDSRTRGKHRLFQERTNNETYRNSFFQQTVRDWNLLPASTVDAATIEELRANLSPTSC